MGVIHKGSQTTIVHPSATRTIRITEYVNPELILPDMLQQYFLEIGFSSMYPNFSTLRIGAVHPFALLLYQSVMGQDLSTNVFPSITVSDSSDSEVSDLLARGDETFVFSSDVVAGFELYRDLKQLLISDDGLTRLKSATAGDGTVVGHKRDIRSRHTIDFNIWSDNKDMTSLIYDLVRHFVLSSINVLHDEKGIDVLDPISGRRSGDINVEFGKLLYGANISVSATISTANMIVDLPEEEIAVINQSPEYQVTS